MRSIASAPHAAHLSTLTVVILGLVPRTQAAYESIACISDEPCRTPIIHVAAGFTHAIWASV